MSSGSSVLSREFYDLGPISDTIGEVHFGTNMLFHSDRTEEGSNFADLISSSGIRSIRYPGGTISEQFFDPSNPNSTIGQNFFDISDDQSNVETREILPFSEYLGFIEDINGIATIVFPTYRYFDRETREISASAKIEISDFFRGLLRGDFGVFSSANIEIGNEWYQKNFDWSTDEFGRLQAEIAKIISETSSSLGLRDNLSIFAQGGADTSSNVSLASFFEGADEEYIDGVLAHIYGTNSQGNTLGIGGAIGPRLEGMMDAWESATDSDLMLAITEWNVGENGPNDTLINGLMRSAPLLRMFAEMILAEVDMAHIWSMQTAGPAGLSGREGTGADWSPTGLLYGMLYDVTIGAQIVDTGSSFRLRDNADQVVGYTYTFSKSESTSILLSSAVGFDVSLDVDLAAVLDDASHVFVKFLTGAPGYVGTEYNAEATMKFLTNLVPIENLSGTDELSLLLGAYETIQITVTYGTGVEMLADSQFAISDVLRGSPHADTIDGALGSDTISGFGGADSLLGGAGNDKISGGKHHDTIDGGAGDDIITGNLGKDSLVGGSGDDTIRGGAWHDSVFGGKGEDSLFGNAGNDLILGEAGDDFVFGGKGDDTLNGGEGENLVFGGTGNDLIYVDGTFDTVNGGAGIDTVSLENFNSAVTVWTQHGIVEAGLGQIELTNVEIIETTRFSDRVSLSEGAGRVLTHQGDDTLEVWDSVSAVAELGAGNDSVFAFAGDNNIISSGDGEDEFFIFNGFNTYFGDSGDDTLLLLSPRGSIIGYSSGDGHDVLSGFSIDRDNLLVDVSLQSSMTVEETRDGTVVSFGHAGSITLLGIYEADLSDSFSFF